MQAVFSDLGHDQNCYTLPTEQVVEMSHALF